MRDLDALAITGEKGGVLTNDVTAAYGLEADGLGISSPGMTFPAVDRARIEITAQRLR